MLSLCFLPRQRYALVMLELEIACRRMKTESCAIIASSRIIRRLAVSSSIILSARRCSVAEKRGREQKAPFLLVHAITVTLIAAVGARQRPLHARIPRCDVVDGWLPSCRSQNQ